ncbi:MAG TPA: hypothetical protein VN643_06530 [Pyrinomonadaceae bacterium]|nr:hypothetical protein [Pyrinomonadaceae bacterium]
MNLRQLIIMLTLASTLCGRGTGVSPVVNVSASQHTHEQDARATPHEQDARATGVIRLRVRVATGDGSKAKGLARKRFYLINDSLADNKDLLEGFAQRAITSRDCYYRSIGASEALISWLRENDCESIYCREVQSREVSSVPEFAHGIALGEKEYGSSELARKWLPVNLPENIRNGFYKRQQRDLLASLELAEQRSRSKVSSVMTDRNGTAYFTDVVPGVYVISNILATELESSSELWSCEVKVSAGDLATATREKPFLIANPGNKDPRDKKNIRCVSLERPLPACQGNVTASGN